MCMVINKEITTMKNMTIHDVHTKNLGQVIAGLVEAGLTFDVYETGHQVWRIELTGGY